MNLTTSFHCRRKGGRVVAMLAVMLLATLPARADPGETVGGGWRAQVERISAGADTRARADAITTRLDALGLPWHEHAFELDGRQGRNLVADLGGPAGAPLLLIGAHYDRVDVGHGATDNASGVATVLELAQALKMHPLATHRVKLAFWDLEEHGLLGARAWIAAPGQEEPALYVNFDVFGWGDTLWMMTPQPETPLVSALRRASSERGLHFSPGETYPPTDHLAFLKAGWPAVSFSLVDAGEITGILDVFAGRDPDPAPKVMRVIHTAQDDISQLDTGNVPKALAVLEAALRKWDAPAAAADTAVSVPVPEA
jgi:aminopeptidase S